MTRRRRIAGCGFFTLGIVAVVEGVYVVYSAPGGWKAFGVAHILVGVFLMTAYAPWLK